MPWARLDDQFWMNRKVRRLPLSAVGLHVLAISYCCQHLSDGYLGPEDLDDICAMNRVADPEPEVAALIAAGLWIPEGDGYLIHDFLEYNKSRSQVEGKREREKERYVSSARSLPAETRQKVGRPPADTRQSAVSRPVPARTHPEEEKRKAGGRPFEAAKNDPPAAKPLDPPADDPFPDEEYLANLDRLRSRLMRRDNKRASQLDPYIRTVLSRSGEFRGLPRRAVRHGLTMALEHLGTNSDVQHWDRYIRHVVLAEAQNVAAEARQEQEARTKAEAANDGDALAKLGVNVANIGR